jgi:transcriptional regulator with XRE-family HTH domain
MDSTTVLSHDHVATYRQFIAYTARVDGFGKRLRIVREARHLSAMDVARAAFAGDDVPAEKIVNFASYIGRIESGNPNSQNLKLDVLERLAHGFGLAPPVFFTQIYGSPAVVNPEGEQSANQILKSGTASVDNDAPTHHEVDDGAAVTFSEALALKALILGLNETLTRVADRVAEGLEQLASPRRSKARPRAPRHPGRRKVG